MKIRTKPCAPNTTRVGSIKHGECFRFRHNLHQKHKLDDVFIRLDACHSYRPERHKYSATIAVGNMRTGALAYTTSDREVYAVDAELCLDE